MDELIKRLEVATGPDRELDAAIALAVDGGEIVWKMANYTMESYPARRYVSANHIGGFGNAPVPPYTASIDAALTLVPEGWSKVIAEKAGLPVQRRWEVWLHDHNTSDGISRYHVEANATTPALAICIAALRARGEA